MMERRKSAKTWEAERVAAREAERRAAAILAGRELATQGQVIELVRQLRAYGALQLVRELERFSRPRRPLKASA